MPKYGDERMKRLETGNAAAIKIPTKSDNVRIGMKLVFCLSLSILAFGNRTTSQLLVLTAVNLLLITAQSFSLRSLRRGAFFFLSQTAVIVILYFIRFGATPDAAWSGFRISWQLYLAFLPSFIFVETTPQPRIAQTLSYVMSHRTAFVMATCLKFLPLLISEIRTIYEGQVMRGARIRPQDLVRPWNWRDVIHCLLVPALVHSLKLAGDIALAARARDFSVSGKRTCWPGD